MIRSFAAVVHIIPGPLIAFRFSIYGITHSKLFMAVTRWRAKVPMTAERESSDVIRKRIEPTLNNVAVDGLRAWLKSIGLPSAAYSRAAITELVSKQIAGKQLDEGALESALIGFEEASDMRIYLFRMDDGPSGKPEKWLPTKLLKAGFALAKSPVFAGEKVKPMSPVYAHLEGGLLRVKWVERQEQSKMNERGDGVIRKPVFKRVVLIADFNKGTAELRMNPPDKIHAHEDAGGRATAETYFKAYADRAAEILGCTLTPIDLRVVVRKLVDKVEPRVVRIHIDNHTNQSNYKTKTTGPRADVRDDPDWRLAYNKNGESWAYDAQSFYWLPKVSSGFLTREVFSHINAEEGFIKVNADCSDKEVTHVISQVRAREAK